MKLDDSDGINPVAVTKRETRKQTHRKNILRSAEEIFLRKGFGSTCIDEIADRAGVTKRTLYTFFPSKLALYVDIYEDYLGELSDEILKAVKNPAPSEEHIVEIFDVLFEFTKRNEKFMRLYWMLDSDEFEGPIPEELIQRVNKITRIMFGNVVAVIKKAQKEDLIVDVDPLLLAHLMSAVNKGIFIHTSKERRLDIANIRPNKLYDILKIILKSGLLKK